jgi:hypothetical protein
MFFLLLTKISLSMEIYKYGITSNLSNKIPVITAIKLSPNHILTSNDMFANCFTASEIWPLHASMIK